MKHIAYSRADEKFIDSIFDTQRLLEQVPQHMEPLMQYIEEERTLDKEVRTLGRLENSTGWTAGRNFKRVACIPQPVWAVAIQIDPTLGENKERFYRWLANHPEYDMRGKVGA